MVSNIHKLYLFNFLTGLQFFGAISIPFFLFWGKLNYTQIFVLQAWFIAWVFILEVPTGTIADKFGRKVSLFLSALVLGFAVFIYSQIPNFYTFLIAEFLFALGVASFSGADKALLYDTLKETRRIKDSKHFFSRYALFNTLGIIIALPLGSIIAGSSILPYPDILTLPLLLTTFPMFLAALTALTMKEPKRIKPKENLLRVGIKGINYFRKHKVLRSFAIDMTLISAATFFIFWLYQPLLLNAGMDIKLIGFVGAAFNIVGVVLLYHVKLIDKTLGAKNMLFLTALVPALAFISLAFFKNMLLVLLGIFVIAGLKLLREPLFDSYMNKFIRSKERATVLSAISMLRNLIMIVFYPVVGFLSDISLSHALAVLGILTLLSALFAKVDEKHLRK